jgi:Cu2+-containing amine oxidase
MKNRVMKEVHDDGLRWANGSEKTRRGEKMLIWALFNGGNYRYILEYGFGDDGMISCRLGATAHNLFDRQKDGRDVHLHVGCWRWDPELCEEEAKIGGANQNRVLLVRRVPRTASQNGQFRADISPFNPDEKGRAMEGYADWKPEEFTMLRVESMARRNGNKEVRYTAYDLVPIRHGTVRNYPWKYAFVNHDFWVTHRRGAQAKYSEVPLYATGSNPLDKTPCTIWHNAGNLHLPRAEDYGVDGVTAGHGAAITTWAGFVLKPVNLFDSTPLYETAGKTGTPWKEVIPSSK